MKKDDALKLLQRQAQDGFILRKKIVDELGPRILEVANNISAVFGSGGKILVAGNGGSAADASHFTAELVVRLTADRNRQALPAICINVDPSVITAAANDFGFEMAIARQVEALGNRGDLLFVISTSGNSENLIRAVSIARERGLVTAGLLGRRGGRLAEQVDRAIIVPHDSTQRIQEEHIFIIHFLVEMVESDLFG